MSAAPAAVDPLDHVLLRDVREWHRHVVLAGELGGEADVLAGELEGEARRVEVALEDDLRDAVAEPDLLAVCAAAQHFEEQLRIKARP